MPTAVPAYLGIDIAKASLAVCLLRDRANQAGTFDNTPAGFKKLASWLKKRKVTRVHACLEATGRYGEGVAAYLHAAGHTVSVINPAWLTAYRRVTATHPKTDAVDAALLADYCQRQQPTPWSPPTPEKQALRALVRRRESLLKLQQQEGNRLESGELPELVVASHTAILTALAEQRALIEQAIADQIAADPELTRQHALLDSLPGIATTTASALLGEIDFAAFPDARQLAAYAGLTPTPHQSGTSVHSPAHLSKHSASQLRRILYFPALSAMTRDPGLHAFAQRLRDRGKASMTVICAVMRKLLHLCYAVLRSGQAFDPHYHSKKNPATQPASQTAQLEAV
jgi:transposase